jgi:hypothetical protein
MSKYTFTDRSDELYSATLYGDVLELTREPEGEHVRLRFWAVDAEKIVKIIRQAAGMSSKYPEPQDACDQSDGEKSDPTDPTINDPHAILAYRKVALDAALAWSSIPRREAPPSPEFVVTAAAMFEKFLFEGATK